MIKGVILQETKYTVSILTLNSSNRKTGPVDTVWIICKNIDPIRARQSGEDKHVCFDCPLRNNGCYVNPRFGVLSVYQAYKAGCYENFEDVPKWFWDSKEFSTLRLGGYGDPSVLKKELVDFLSSKYRTTLGYTYQWKKDKNEFLKPYCMASCHNDKELKRAKKKGWSIFFIKERITIPMDATECPYGKTHLQCNTCGLCTGTRNGQKFVAINAHGYQCRKAKGEEK